MLQEKTTTASGGGTKVKEKRPFCGHRKRLGLRVDWRKKRRGDRGAQGAFSAVVQYRGYLRCKGDSLKGREGGPRKNEKPGVVLAPENHYLGQGSSLQSKREGKTPHRKKVTRKRRKRPLA